MTITSFELQLQAQLLGTLRIRKPHPDPDQTDRLPVSSRPRFREKLPIGFGIENLINRRCVCCPDCSTLCGRLREICKLQLHDQRLDHSIGMLGSHRLCDPLCAVLP